MLLFDKYRPQTLNDLVIPEELKNTIRKFVNEDMPHLGLFSFTPGTGKSSLANVIIKETGAEYIWINASLDRGIDIIKNDLSRFASTKSFNKAYKIAVLDEFDNFAAQESFRGFIDTYGENVRFIFTGNRIEKIIQPLLDRMFIIDFQSFKPQLILKELYKRVQYIADNEHISYDENELKKLVVDNIPRVRQIISVLEGNITIENDRKIFKYDRKFNDDNISLIIELIKKKDIKRLNSLCFSISPEGILRMLARNVDKFDYNLNVVITISEYLDRESRISDKNVNLFGACCEIIRSI